jgi:hypothetical protein
VLHLDPAAHYGGSWASLRPREWAKLLATPADAATAGVSDALTWHRPGADLGAGGQQAEGQYSLDLAPKVAYGAGPLIQLLLGSGAHHYLEFKLVQGRWACGLSPPSPPPPNHPEQPLRGSAFRTQAVHVMGVLSSARPLPGGLAGPPSAGPPSLSRFRRCIW